jgi:hypothetical protein
VKMFCERELKVGPSGRGVAWRVAGPSAEPFAEFEFPFELPFELDDPQPAIKNRKRKRIAAKVRDGVIDCVNASPGPLARG